MHSRPKRTTQHEIKLSLTPCTPWFDRGRSAIECSNLGNCAFITVPAWMKEEAKECDRSKIDLIRQEAEGKKAGEENSDQ
ncbi:MAG: hypothetical protein D6728_14470 [Cyanobacteria bacterium J055]|nr:MAG: hypothetical protein D6728_14470 [Cyanobacteria bacterium J055]